MPRVVCSARAGWRACRARPSPFLRGPSRTPRRLQTLRSRKLLRGGPAPRVVPLLALVPAFSAALLVLGTSSTAHALPLVTLSGSARGLYGSRSDDVGLNPYGGGIGLRLGVTLPAALYLGGSFDYFFGESETNAVDVEQSISAL